MNADEQMIDDLMLILGEVIVGSGDCARRLRRLDLAVERMRAHQPERVPSHQLGEVGGSSSPTEIAERAADEYVGRVALADEPEMKRLRRDLARTAAALRAKVVFHTGTVDHSQLPGEPDCRSCSRAGKVNKQDYEGHRGIPVYEKAKKHGLCRWCYEYARADGIAQGFKGLGALPPIEVVDLFHRVSPRAAGLELARRQRDAERRKQKKAS